MANQQNICFFNTTKFWGGGEKWHFETAEMMARTHNPTFFVADGNSVMAKKLAKTPIKQYHITTGNLSFLNPAKVNQLVKFYKENKIDTVIFNSPKDLKLGGKAAKKANVRNIIYRRGIAVEVKKSPVNKKLYKDVVTHFIFNSESTKQLLIKNFEGILEGKKTAIIYNAVDFQNTENINKKDQKATILIGNAGRLVEQKGQKNLIEIARILKTKGLDFKLLIAGEGPLHEQLQIMIDQYHLHKQINLLGFVEDMKTFMAQIDIFVSTALWEGFGFVLAEAMAAQKPVLGFNLSSNPELINDGENGFLIKPQNLGEFAEKLALLINDDSLRDQMGKKAYQFAKTNFEKESQFQKLLDFIS